MPVALKTVNQEEIIFVSLNLTEESSFDPEMILVVQKRLGRRFDLQGAAVIGGC